MGSTRRKGSNLTVRRLELIASDLVHGAAPGRFVLSDSGWIKLPSPVNRFVGRHPELMGLQLPLDAARLVMLTGAAGVGKRRLGVEAARQRRHRNQAGRLIAYSSRMLRVGVLIDLPPEQAYHIATLTALEHAAHALEIAVTACVLRTRAIPGDLSTYAAIVVGPGSPYDDPEAVHSAIQTARERGIPLVGT
jgi:hypothetical protein